MSRVVAVLCLILTAVLTTIDGRAGEQSIVIVNGSVFMASAVDRAARSFKAEHPEWTVVVSGGGATQAIRSLLAGKIDIAMSGRSLDGREMSMAGNKEMEIGTQIMAADGLAVIVHPSNPVDSVTVDQLRGIFTGEFTSWKDLGGSAGPITICMSDPKKHGDAKFFKTIALRGADFGKALILSGYSSVIKVVRHRKEAVAFCASSKAFGRKGIKVLSIKKDAESPPIPLSPETITNRSYPILRPAYFLWDANAEKVKPALRPFIDYCSSKRLAVE